MVGAVPGTLSPIPTSLYSQAPFTHLHLTSPISPQRISVFTPSCHVYAVYRYSRISRYFPDIHHDIPYDYETRGCFRPTKSVYVNKRVRIIHWYHVVLVTAVNNPLAILAIPSFSTSFAIFLLLLLHHLYFLFISLIICFSPLYHNLPLLSFSFPCYLFSSFVIFFSY